MKKPRIFGFLFMGRFDITQQTVGDHQMHEVEWTPDKVARFWDFYSSHGTPTYFASDLGKSVVNHVARRIRIGRALDLGCGSGGLIGHLAGRFQVAGADQSPVTVQGVNHRFAGKPNFLGATVGTVGLPDASFDTVFLIEVVEHLDDERLAELVSEARRLLKPGGHVVITTPNDEPLDQSKRMCPDCGCVFHQMQHVRSWSPNSLSAYLLRAGFRTVSCERTIFTPYGGLKRLIQLARYSRRKAPNLIYIGAN